MGNRGPTHQVSSLTRKTAYPQLCTLTSSGKAFVARFSPTYTGKGHNIDTMDGNRDDASGISRSKRSLASVNTPAGSGNDELDKTAQPDAASTKVGPEDAAKQERENADPENIKAISTVDEAQGDYDVRKENHFGEAAIIDNAKDLVTHVLHVDDEPSDSPWTFRALFIGNVYRLCAQGEWTHC